MDLEPEKSDLTNLESIINDSRLTPTGNGATRPVCTQPTDGHKMWVAVLSGIVFALISSPVAYFGTGYVSQKLGGLPTMYGTGPNLAGLLLHTIIFIGIIRLILW